MIAFIIMRVIKAFLFIKDKKYIKIRDKYAPFIQYSIWSIEDMLINSLKKVKKINFIITIMTTTRGPEAKNPKR